VTEAEFRAKYPHSTDDQVRLYLEAVAAEAASPPQPEPDIPMPIITVPAPAPPPAVTTYSAGLQVFAPYLEEAPPDWHWQGDLRDVLASWQGLTQGQRDRLPDMSEDDALAFMFDPKEFEARV
jgi:hypothetical protein